MSGEQSDQPEWLEVPSAQAGERLDRILAAHYPQHSRARVQGWIRDGHVLLDGVQPVPRTKPAAGARIEIRVPVALPVAEVQAQPIPLDVIFEDDALLVINKPVGLVAHPGAGTPDGTLQNALLHYRPELAAVARAGLIHRLDKDTSGLLVVAATPEAQTALSRAMQAREINRHYLALVRGVLIAGGTVDAAIARDVRDRKRMAVSAGGRHAVTHYRVAERFRNTSLLRVQLETGRTHQIRVHMKHIGHPLVGDRQYGSRGDLYRERIARQALHAGMLGLRHPFSNELMEWSCEAPPDMADLISALRRDSTE